MPALDVEGILVIAKAERRRVAPRAVSSPLAPVPRDASEPLGELDRRHGDASPAEDFGRTRSAIARAHTTSAASIGVVAALNASTLRRVDQPSAAPLQQATAP